MVVRNKVLIVNSDDKLGATIQIDDPEIQIGNRDKVVLTMTLLGFQLIHPLVIADGLWIPVLRDVAEPLIRGNAL